MQTAISINSRYRRAARHPTWWVRNVCEGQDEDRLEKELGQRIHIQVLDQVYKTTANYNHIIVEWCYRRRRHYTGMSSEGCAAGKSPLVCRGFGARNSHLSQLELVPLRAHQHCVALE